MGLKPRFFRIPEFHISGTKAAISPALDVLPLDVFTDHVKLYDFEDGTVLISALVKRYSVQSMAEYAELDDPLSMAGVVALGLHDCYVGMDYSETPYVGLFWFLPELKGTKTIVVEGVNTEIDIIPRITWGAK